MKSDPHVAEPRSAVILRYTRCAIRDRQLVVTNFSSDVVDHYLAVHEVHLRVVKFREPVGDIDAIHDALKHNAQIVDRYIKGVLRALPADIEESWTNALPPAYRIACQRELVRRYGFIGALVRTGAESPAATLSDVMHEFGDFLATNSLALADGQYDATERTEVARQIDDVLAALTSLRYQVMGGQAPASVARSPRGANDA